MAGVVILGVATIDYSINDGRVRSFVLRDETLYDEDRGVNKPGWRERLIQFVKEEGLDVDDGRGLHAFVGPLMDSEETRGTG